MGKGLPTFLAGFARVGCRFLLRNRLSNLKRDRTIVPDAAVKSLAQADGGEERGSEPYTCEVPGRLRALR